MKQIQDRLGKDYEPDNEAVILDTHKMYTSTEQNHHENPISEGLWLYDLLGELGGRIAMTG